MLFSAVPAFAVPMVDSYSHLLMVAFFLGMAGSSFAVGVGFVSPWFRKEQQGSALGVYGLGNIGQSAAVFLGPVLALRIGWQNVFRGLAALLVAWAVIFALSARNAEALSQPKSLGAMLSVLGTATSSVGTFGVLFSEFRRFRRFFDLFAEPIEGRIPPGGDGCRLSHGGFRGPGDRNAPDRRMALGSASAGPAFCRSRSSAWFRSRSCWPGIRCCRSRWARWDVRRCSAWPMARYSSWFRNTFPLKPERSPVWSARWEDSAAFSRHCCSAYFKDRLGVDLAWVRAPSCRGIRRCGS